MKTNPKNIALIRTAARILGTVAIAFVLFMIGALLFGKEGFGAFQSKREILSFMLFPVGTLIGFGLAWKWEGIGGLISLVSLLGFHLLRPDLGASFWIDIMALPAMLFVLYWLFTKNNHHTNSLAAH